MRAGGGGQGRILVNPAFLKRGRAKDDEEESEGHQSKRINNTESRIFSAAESLRSGQCEAVKTVDERELQKLMRVPADTDEDKWTILKQLDSLVYQGRDDRNESNLKGICKDMCPEKERYGRSFKQQLRIYEKLDGVLDPRLAVKEHSRSAADQEIPPPTELRTLRALHMTMDHLIHNVVSRNDLILDDIQEEWSQIPLSEWYLFIWSSTRAIRKEVTQQNLFSSEGLAILSKILRFHIVCNEEMADETNFSFDRKLNDENAIKCLKTITQMIEDGVECPNQPEIRSYEILYNLNDGQVLLQVAKLPRALRNHPEIQFSIQCHSAINNSNPVKFFRLMSQASFLQACIMRRYMYQMRLMALTLTRVYVPGKSMIELPMEKMMTWLYMEDYTKCCKFLRSHGFESEDETVFVERTSFNPPEETPNQGCSELIRDKMDTSLEEVVNGGVLGRNPLLDYVPHDSFTADGKLKQDVLDASIDASTVNVSYDNSTVGMVSVVEHHEEDEYDEDQEQGDYEDDEQEYYDDQEQGEDYYAEDVVDETEEYEEAADEEVEDEGEEDSAVSVSQDDPEEIETVQEDAEAVNDEEDEDDSDEQQVVPPMSFQVTPLHKPLAAEQIPKVDPVPDKTNEITEQLTKDALDLVLKETVENILKEEISKESKLRSLIKDQESVLLKQIINDVVTKDSEKIVREVHESVKRFIEVNERIVFDSLINNLITETTNDLRKNLDLDLQRKFFNLWRHNARCSSMLRRGYHQERLQHHVEKFCYNRIVKFILAQHSHRLSRDQVNPPPDEIIQFINQELQLLISEVDDDLQSMMTKLRLEPFGDHLEDDKTKAVKQILDYVDNIRIPGAILMRNNVERILHEHLETSEVTPSLRVFAEIFSHKFLYLPLTQDISERVVWTRDVSESPDFVFSSPNKRKQSPEHGDERRPAKLPRQQSKILKAASEELKQCQR